MESVKFPSHGGFSVRSILTFALAAIIAAFLWITFSSSPALAVGEATWGGDSIIFENRGFTAVTDISDPSGTILPGSSVYRTPTKPAGTGSDASEKVFIIYFSPGVDPPTATTAQFAEFTYDDGTLSNPQNKQDITLTLKSQQTASSSCTVEGIGWILCPATTWLAKGMDGIFDILSGFIETKPPTLGDSANSMYVAWNVMRTIANIAFVIAFLIIIYSQLTSIGVSNYGLKKLIPRLIVAAVLVNVSFYVAALAIDISNILGYSIQDIFNSIRESTFRLTSDDLGSSLSGSWAQVASIMLAGGGLYAGAYYVAVAGGIYMLVPLLVMLLVTIMLVLVILAARQAIILILVILAPLAFVANLLPNTEKWFDKWKDLFMTMLIFFPAFSLVFGGSQLAGQLIIQNAGNNIITVLFGLAVQIAPLVITPLLFKFSGGLLGRIGQIANNPSKGVLDRSRNWGSSRAELAKKRSMGIDRKKANPWRLGAAVARRSDFDNRRVKDKTDMWAQAATNKYEETPGFSKIHEQKAGVDMNKERIHNDHTAHVEHLKTHQGSTLHARTVELEASKAAAERATAQTSHMISGYRANTYIPADAPESRMKDLQKAMAHNVIETAAWKQGEEANRYVQQRNISNSLEKNQNILDSADAHTVRVGGEKTLLDIAQGYGDVELRGIGRDRAQATAVATLSKLNKDARENAITLIQSEAVSQGKSVIEYAAGSVFKKANSADPAERKSVSPTRLEAALEIIAGEGHVPIFDDARSSEFIDQTVVDAVVARHVGDMKSKGGFHIQANPGLSLQRYLETFNAGDTLHGTTIDEVKNKFVHDLSIARLKTLSNTNSANLGNVKFTAFSKLAEGITATETDKNLLSAIEMDESGKPKSAEDAAMVQRIFESLRDGLSDPSTRATMTDRLVYARDMEEEIRKRFFSEMPPLTISNSERIAPGGTERPPSAEDDELESLPDSSTIDGAPSDGDDQA